jgi:hypothetical protein
MRSNWASQSARRILVLAPVALAATLTAAPSFGAAIGPSPYLSQSDSPWAGLPFTYFHLDDFEDGTLNTPGVTAIGAQSFLLPGGVFTDSVDGDDGSIDGSGTNGTSQYTADGAAGIQYAFNALALGGLPTHAGIVWTDLSGVADVFLEAFDATDASLGILAAGSLNDGASTGETAEDRFLGWTNSGGIWRIRVYQSASDMEVDHLQYGLLVPEPAAWLVSLLGLGGLMARRK